MKFFLYLNKNVVFDYLGRNLIAPDSIVKDIKRFRTVSTAADYFLFMSHKKLNRASRIKGIVEPEFVCPITLEISDILDTDAQAILVEQSEDGNTYVLDCISKYDSQRHIGAYLIGEVPFSRVSRIYFDSQEEMDMFYRPSPDYWYPKDKFYILPDDFNEDFALSVEQDKLIEASGMTVDSVLSDIRSREKIRAGLLNFINCTEKWQYKKYAFSIDPALQGILGITDQDISTVLPHYLTRDSSTREESLVLYSNKINDRDCNQVLFDIICEEMLLQPFGVQKQSAQMLDILSTISNKGIAFYKDTLEASLILKSMIEIEKLISDSSNKCPEEIIASIPESVDVLKALLFVVKNPNRYDLFLTSLDAYNADQLTKRRASYLWGILNGLYGMPGDGHNKDNPKLWNYIEGFVYKNETRQKPTLSVEEPQTIIENGFVFGIRLTEERIITSDEAQTIVLAIPKEKLTKQFYEKLLNAAMAEFGSSKKLENKGYVRKIASISLPEIKCGDVLTPNHKKALDLLISDYKKPVPNREKLYKEYVESKEKFSFVFETDPEYWKQIVRSHSEN